MKETVSLAPLFSTQLLFAHHSKDSNVFSIFFWKVEEQLAKREALVLEQCWFWLRNGMQLRKIRKLEAMLQAAIKRGTNQRSNCKEYATTSLIAYLSSKHGLFSLDIGNRDQVPG